MLTLLIALAAVQQRPVEGPHERSRPTEEGLEARISWWMPNLNGTLVSDEGIGAGANGSRLSLDSDLGFDDEPGILRFELGSTGPFGAGQHTARVERLTFSFWSHTWEADEVLDEDVVFNGHAYPAGSPVASRFRVGSFGVDALAFAAGIPGADFDGAFTVCGRVVDVKATLDSPVADASERTRLAYFGPGFRGEWTPSPQVFGAVSAAMLFSFGDIQDEVVFDFETWAGVVVEASAAVGFRSDHLKLLAGFRMFSNAFDIERDNSDASEENVYRFFLGGPFFELGLSF